MPVVGGKRRAYEPLRARSSRRAISRHPPAGAGADGSRVRSGSSASRARSRGSRRAGLEAGTIGFALDDEVVGAAGEAIEGALRADGVGEGGEPLIRAAVAGDNQGASAVAV